MNLPRTIAASSGRTFMPIAAVLPYRKDYCFKARVTDKGDMHEWNNEKGSGRLFVITFMDGNGDTMVGRFFTQAAEKFNPILFPGRVYEFCDGKISMPQRPNGTTSDYEVTFDQNSTINELQDDGTIPRYSTKKLVSLDHIPTIQDTKAPKDYMGVVHAAKPLTAFTTKTGKPSHRREVTIVDKSGLLVDCTFWGEQASKYQDEQFANNPVIIIQSAAINEYRDTRSLQSTFSTSVVFNASDKKAADLLSWYNTAPHSDFKALRDFGTKGADTGPKRVYSRDRFSDIDEDALKDGVAAAHFDPSTFVEWLNIEGYVSRIMFSPPDAQGGKARMLWYEACPGRRPDGKTCNKKIVQTGELYTCDACNHTGDCEYRYIMSAQITDESGSRYVNFFDDQAQILIGRTAHELHDMIIDGNYDRLSEFLQGIANKPIHFTCMVRIEQRDGNFDVRYRAHRVENPPTYIKQAQNAIEEIKYLKEQI